MVIIGYASGRVVESSGERGWLENIPLLLTWVGSVVGTAAIYVNTGGPVDLDSTWQLFVTVTGLLVAVPSVPLAVTYSQVKAKPLGRTLKRFGFASVVTVLTVAGVFLVDSIAWRALTTGVVFAALVLGADRIKPWFVGYDRTDTLGELYDLGSADDGTSVRTVPTREVAVEVLSGRGGSEIIYVSSGLRDRLSPETQLSLIALERRRRQNAFRQRKQFLLGLPLVAVVAVLPRIESFGVLTALPAVAVGAYYLLVAPRLVGTLVYRDDERTVSQIGTSALNRALDEYAAVVSEHGGRFGPVFGPTYRERQRRLTDGER